MVKSTNIKANNISELTKIVNDVRSIAEDWCRTHDNYTYSVKMDKSALLVKLTIEKFD